MGVVRAAGPQGCWRSFDEELNDGVMAAPLLTRGRAEMVARVAAAPTGAGTGSVDHHAGGPQR
jgi:hypothetical protein